MRRPKLVCRNFNGKLLGIYESVQEAADDLFLDVEDLKNGYCSGFILTKEMVDITANCEKDNRGRHKHIKTSVPVVQLDLKTKSVINTYHSMYEALRQTGVSTIARVCKGYAKSAGGYGWMFKSDYDRLTNDLM